MKLALIGVGLIGGSAAIAWRRTGAVAEVIGFDHDAAALARARELGVIDQAALSAAAAVREADLVLIAVPVGAMKSTFAAIAGAVPAHALITDVGSTKRSVIDAARVALNASGRLSFGRFVPGHPIAGRERPGVDNADGALFDGKLYVSTPVADTDTEALARIEDLWTAAGAKVSRMDADEHDRIFAAVSHLPHLLAFALVARIASEADGEHKLEFAGAGFRDFTRIAASSPEMWRDISVANRAALGEELRGYRALLDEMQRAVDAGDAAAIERVFDLASRTRRRHARTFDAE
ncbi:MAG: prephenate dehydrogenase [Gemmatimonadota bacterium]